LSVTIFRPSTPSQSRRPTTKEKQKSNFKNAHPISHTHTCAHTHPQRGPTRSGFDSCRQGRGYELLANLPEAGVEPLHRQHLLAVHDPHVHPCGTKRRLLRSVHVPPSSLPSLPPAIPPTNAPPPRFAVEKAQARGWEPPTGHWNGGGGGIRSHPLSRGRGGGVRPQGVAVSREGPLPPLPWRSDNVPSPATPLPHPHARHLPGCLCSRHRHSCAH